MRLWFCSPGCREAANDQPRPWGFPLSPDACPICLAPRPAVFAYFVAQAAMSDGYYAFTARPLITVGNYVIVEADATWKAAVWEQLMSGLQLGVVEIFDAAAKAMDAAATLNAWDEAAGRPYVRETWPLVVRRLRRWQLELAHDDGTDDVRAKGAYFTLLRRNGKKGFVSVRKTGEVATYADLFEAVGKHFPGRFRVVLADAWTRASAV
jgi:hypothetical protein